MLFDKGGVKTSACVSKNKSGCIDVSVRLCKAQDVYFFFLLDNCLTFAHSNIKRQNIIFSFVCFHFNFSNEKLLTYKNVNRLKIAKDWKYMAPFYDHMTVRRKISIRSSFKFKLNVHIRRISFQAHVMIWGIEKV